MVARPSASPMSVDTYLELEANSTVKHEYIDGYVYAMAGGTRRNSVIATNVRTALVLHLRGTQCRVYDSDVKVRLGSRRFVYPDVSITCDERDILDQDEEYIQYPSMVIEILSPSTEDYDRGGKFGMYRNLSSLLTYVLVSTHQQLVELYQRPADPRDAWIMQRYTAGDEVELPALNFRAPIGTFYVDVAL